jgi:uncharacterized protein YcbK (DUF882 family)
MIPGICWTTFNTKDQKHVDALVNAGFKSIRIFFNLCDLQNNPTLNVNSSSQAWQLYINHCFVNMPDGMHAWTYEGRTGLFACNDKMKDSFDLCEKLNWLPVVCMGYQEEEPHNWLDRAIGEDKWAWVARFTKEFALFIKSVYGFKRADLEVWNEPSKLQSLGFGWDKYVRLASLMARAWKTVPGYKVHVFADDIQNQDYLDKVLSHDELMSLTDYIGTHCGVGTENAEWDRDLVRYTADKIKAKYPKIKQALTEMSPNGQWDRMDQLPGNVEMYGIILAIRKIEFGTAFVIDDVWMHSGSTFKVSSPEKAQILKDFNAKYNTWTGGETPIMYNALTQLTPNFRYGEFFCLGKQPPDTVYPNILALAVELQKVRDKVKVPIVINSGWRDVPHNEVVGGASNSQHLTGKGADVSCPKIATKEFNIYLAKYGNFNGFGIGSNYTHVDIRSTFTIWSY